MKEGKKKLALFLCLSMLLSICAPIVSHAANWPSVGASVSTNNAVQVVSTQANLKKALAKGSVKQIVIKTEKAVSFEIPKGTYSNKNLIVRAPKAEVWNEGVFKNISIYAISDHSYVENADHNKLRVLASSGRIVVQANKTVDALTIAKKNSKVKVDVSGNVQQMDVKKASTLTMDVTGGIEKMNVNATSTVEVAGDSKDTTVVVNKAAKNSKITISAPVTVKLKASTTVTLKSGAENAKLVVPKSATKVVSYTLVNDTNATLKLNTSSGTKMLAKGKSYNGKESGSSNTTIMGGGSSGGGSTGGSGNSGSTGGSSGKPADKDEDDTTTKAKLAVSLQALGLSSFRVYVDTEYELGDLDVTITPDAGKVTQISSVSQWHSDTNSYGRLQKYTYCYDFTTENALDMNQEYTVSVAKKNGYQFDEKTFNIDSILGELAYGPHYVEVESTDTEDAMKKAAMRYVEGCIFWDTFLNDIEIEDYAMNCPCPVKVKIEQNDIEKEISCELYFIATDTEEGQWMYVKNDLQKYFYKYYSSKTDDSGHYFLFEDMPYEGIQVTWESKDEDVLQIDGNIGRPKQLGLGDWKQVHLIAHLSNKGGTKTADVPVELTISGDPLAYFNVYVNSSEDNRDKWEVTYQKIDEQWKSEKLSFQWYVVEAPGYGNGAKAIEGATSKVYSPQNPGKKGTFWYYCVLKNTVGDAESLSFSHPIMRKSFTGDKEDKLIAGISPDANPKEDGNCIVPGIDFPKVTAQSNLVVFYSYREQGSDEWRNGLPYDAGTYEITAYTVGNETYREASRTFTVTIE